MLSCLLLFTLLLSGSLGCIPTVSPDEDDIWAEMEEATTLTAMLTSTTCGAACDTTTSNTAVPTTTATTTTTTTTATTTTTTTTTTTAPPCLNMNDRVLDNSCYRFIQTTTIFPEAAMQCAMLNGGTLCIITSQAEATFLSDYFTDIYMSPSQFHMGGERMSDTDPYIWPDSVPFSSTWTNWASGEPQMNPARLCTQFRVPSTEWASEPCTSNSYSCCEYPAMMSG